MHKLLLATVLAIQTKQHGLAMLALMAKQPVLAMLTSLVRGELLLATVLAVRMLASLLASSRWIS